MTKSGQWDRLDDEILGQEHITVRRTFSIVEENDVDEAQKARSSRSGQAVIVAKL